MLKNCYSKFITKTLSLSAMKLVIKFYSIANTLRSYVILSLKPNSLIHSNCNIQWEKKLSNLNYQNPRQYTFFSICHYENKISKKRANR